MHSSELARLARVSVRTLRHYHQIGVLDEPARSSNGYRRYDVHDLVRVLRIRRLASLGIPLERAPGLLDGAGDEGTDGVLDDLDRELTDEIDRLGRQRDVVARLRDLRAAPDLPPELAPFLQVFSSAGLSPELARIDREQSVLLAHLVGAGGMSHLAGLYERLSNPGIVPEAVALAERFDGLGPDSTEGELAALVEGFMVTFGPLLDELASADVPWDLSGSQDLLSQYAVERFNEQQRQAFELLACRLDDSECGPPQRGRSGSISVAPGAAPVAFSSPSPRAGRV